MSIASSRLVVSPRILTAVALCVSSVVASRSSAQTPVIAFDAQAEPAAIGGDLAKRREHASVAVDRLRDLGAEAGVQARIAMNDSTFALFTIQAGDDADDAVIRLGPPARRRLRSDAPLRFPARVVVGIAPRSDLSDEQADALGELVERLDDDGFHTGLLVMAPHGGEIEKHTDLQAARVKQALSDRPVSTWIVKGYDPPGPQSAFGRWHITSTEMHEASYPLLARVGMRRYDHAVSFHGMSGKGILIGGAGPAAMKEEIRAALAAAVGGRGVSVVVARPGQPLGGDSPANIVNRYSEQGIQIEQGSDVRLNSWRVIADAVAEVYRGKLAPRIPSPSPSINPGSSSPVGAESGGGETP